MKRASVLAAFFPRRTLRRVKRKFRLCDRCGAWTHGHVREHDTLCFAIETNARLLGSGHFLAFVHPPKLSSPGCDDLPLARWPRRPDTGRAHRDGYDLHSTRSQFSTVAHYAASKPSKRSLFDENKALTEKLRSYGYSDGEITLALWSVYDQ